MTSQPIFTERYVEQLRKTIYPPRYGVAPFPYDPSYVVNHPSIPIAVSLRQKCVPVAFDDYETAIAIYEAYSGLSPLQATDPRLWTYLSHTELHYYMFNRWQGFRGRKDNEARDYILAHWFLPVDPSQQTLMQHPLAGLWWAVHLTILRDDPVDRYKLTKILFRNQDVRTRTLGTYALARHRPAIHSILQYVLDNEEFFKRNYEDKMRYLLKRINMLGASVLLSYHGKEYFETVLNSIADDWNTMQLDSSTL